MMHLEDEEKSTCEICGAFPIVPIKITLEDVPVDLCSACAATCHVGKWKAR